MSDFHYVRTLGGDGGVDVCSGQAIGEELGAILEDGLPPFNVALHIISALCEILDITEEDGEIHGNIDPRYIFIDDTGAVSLEGFGQSRTRAPEGKPRGPMTDLYGLGFTAFKLFTSDDLPQLPTDDADAHDDAVIDEILAIDFEGLNEEMVGDVQWFLAKLLAFDREDRPPAVECWRTFVAFADEARGPDFVNWCLDALDGGGERRSGSSGGAGAGAGSASAAPEEPADDLGGPLVSRGPLQRGGLAFDPGAAAAGGTAFFSKDDLKAALDRQEPQKPAAGGGSATSYWSRDELSAMAQGGNEAPRPKRAKGEGERRKTMAMQKKDLQRSRGTASATKPARNEQKIKSDPPVPAAPPPPAHRPAPPVPKPPQPQRDFDRPAAFDQPEPTIRMQSDKPRTTRTPAPAPQVFRPPGLAGNDASAAPGRPSRSPSQQPQRPLEPQPSEVATRVQDAAEVQQALRDAEAQRAREARTQDHSRADAQPAPAIKGPQNPPPQLPVEPPVPAYDTGYVEADDQGSSFNLVLIGGIALILVVAIVACIGLGGLGGVVAFVTTGSTSTPVQAPDPAPVPAPLPPPALPKPGGDDVGDDGTTDANDKDGTKPSPAPSTRPTPRPSPSPSPRPSTRPTPRPSPSPSPTPRPTTRPTPRPSPTPSPQPMVRPQPTADPEPVGDPAPVTGPITLTLKSRDRGRLMCPGVGSKEFDGNTMINIESYQLPATCLVTIEGKKEAFQVKGAGSVTCNLAGTRVSCDKSVVQ